MKKIAICTLTKSLNYGAYLQAFALKEILINNGYETGFIEVNKKIYKIKEIFRFIVKKDIRKIPYNIKQYKKYKEVWNLLPVVKKDKKFDCIIIGSDEIWNLKNNSFYHAKEFFGRNLDSKKVISYAPSCSSLTKDELESFDKKITFNNFDRISVRDQNTQRLVKDCCNVIPEIVLDPTMLIDNYRKYQKEDININEKYILIYGYGFDDKSIKDIKRFANKKKLNLYSIGLAQTWCEKNIDATPFDFLNYISNASYIITETFHGTIFSILYNKNFAVYAGKKCKVNYLLKKFGLEDRNVSKFDLEQTLENKVEYSRINDLIVKEREKSLEWLKNAIEK